MNAYWAIIKDSFREAFSSRVLPFLLGIFTLTLAALAPLGLSEESTADLTLDDVVDTTALIERLRRDADAEGPSPGKHLWRRMPEDVQQALTPAADDKGGKFRARAALRSNLNRQLHEVAFYDAPSWAGVELTKEGRELADRAPSSLSPEQLARRNRLALEAAYPGLIVQSPPTAVKMSYLGGDIPFIGEAISQFTVRREDVQQVVQGLLSLFCRYFLGMFGVFVAILVSAAIIPRMFEPGAIDLLLSKPVSRSGLFLTKFFSGCAFILVNIAYFMIGIWFLCGVRLGVWSAKLLLTIPLFLFIFMIVYSISAIAGVLWRNAIISVIASCLIWGFCLTLGFFKAGMDVIWNTSSFAQVVSAGDTLIATTKSGEAFRWNAESREWQEALRGTSASGPMPGAGQGPSFGISVPFLSLLYDAERDQIVGVQSIPSPFGTQSSGASGAIVVGRREDGFDRTAGITAPAGAQSLYLDSKKRLVAAGVSGIFRCDGDPSTTRRPFKVFGFDIAGRQEGPAFVRKGPDDSSAWGTPFAAAMDRRDDSLVIYERGKLRRYALGKSDTYEKSSERELDLKTAAVVGVGGSNVLLANAAGDVLVLDGRTLETTATFAPFGKSTPRSIAASPDGRWFAVLYHEKKLWLYNTESGRQITRGIQGQGDITAAVFTDDGNLLVAYRTNRVARLSPEEWKTAESWIPPSDGWDRTYRYVVLPLYHLLPKPGHVDYLINYLFTEEDAEGVKKDDLQSERLVVNMWEPVWQNLAFLAVVLGLTCVYISRKDF